MSGLFPAIGRWIVRWRYLVLVAVIAVVAAGGREAGQAKAVLKSGGFEIPGTESARAATVLRERFGLDSNRNVLLVFRSQRYAADDPGFRAEVERKLAAVAAVAAVARVTDPYVAPERFVSSDGRTAYGVVLLEGDDGAVMDAVPSLRAAVAGGEVETLVTGRPAFNYDVSEEAEGDLQRAERIALPLVGLLLLLAFRSLFAALLPLVLGAAAIALSLGSLAVIGRITDVSIFALNIATMLGLGLAIDFSLLLVSRFREELRAGVGTATAVVATVATAGRSVAFSGLTVIAATGVLLLYDSMVVRSISLALLLVAAMAVAGALTLVPAALAIAGRRIDLVSWRAGAPLSEHGFWYGWAMAVMRRPLALLLLGGFALVALALPALGMNRQFISARALAPTLESRRGADALGEAFGSGLLAPIQVVIDSGRADGALAPGLRVGIAELDRRIRERKDVASVTSLASVLPTNAALPATLAALPPDPRLRAALSAVLDLDQGRATLAQVVLSDPDSIGARALVRELRTTIVPSIAGLRGSGVLVGGEPAFVLDTDDNLYGQFPLLVAGVLLAVFLVLLAFFRSLTLPLKAVGLNLLSIGAAYGVIVLVFQHGIGASALGFAPLGGIRLITPIISFSILFGLSTDYEVFILSRVREAYLRTGDNTASVASGIDRTAGLITAAAAIMIVVFGAFATAEAIVVKEVGVALVAAIAIDATIVRLIMVPAAMRLMGRWNWWLPSGIARRLPAIAPKAPTATAGE